MAGEARPVDSTAEEITAPDEARSGEPAPDLAEAVDPLLPELAVLDPHDPHEVMVRMDDHDVRMLLEQVQSSALRKWVYDLSEDKLGLTVHAVQDITQRMNWTGKCRIGLLLDANGRPVLDVEQITADEGNGPEPFWVATAYARDEVTGMVLPGSSMEPQRMRLKAWTAAKKRKDGQQIPEDNTLFDRFSRQKAIQKATRNALGAFIPEEIKQTVLAMASKNPGRVQRIQTKAEQRVADLPPALTDDRAKKQIARCRQLYSEIRELGGGRGKVELPPGQFHSNLTAAQHDHERLDDFIGYLVQRRDEMARKFEVAS